MSKNKLVALILVGVLSCSLAFAAFPTTSTLDDFNRANNTSLGASWTEITTSFEIVSNTAQATAGDGYIKWNTNYGNDAETYTTVNQDPGSYFNVNIRYDTAADTGYFVEWTGGTTVNLRRSDGGGSYTTLGTASRTFANGYKIGISCTGTTIKAFTDEGAGWVERISVTDSTYNRTGSIGVYGGGGIIIDNFGGGTISSAASTKQLSLLGVGG